MYSLTPSLYPLIIIKNISYKDKKNRLDTAAVNNMFFLDMFASNPLYLYLGEQTIWSVGGPATLG